jgi:uncharacterized RDD family membrane protein YckC
VSALEKLSIDTPEQVALEFPLAGIGSRFLAVAVDTIAQAAAISTAILAAAIAGGFTGGAAASGRWLLGALILFWFLLNTGYFAIFEAIWNGQTPGKRLIGLRVIDMSGGPITVYAAILRNLLRIADELPGIYAIGILSVLITERQQRLGDLAAGTVVVHEREERLMDLPRSRAPAVPLGARRLGAADVTLVEAFLHRRESLDPVVRLETSRQISRRMAASLQVEVGGDEERFLDQLAAEYRGGSYGAR